MTAAIVAAAAVSAVTIPAFGRWARSRNLLDVPNDRSSHTVPTPRVGGLGLVLGVVTGLAVSWVSAGALMPHAFALLGGAAVIFLIGAADDVRPLSPVFRLAAQLTVAATLAFVSGPSLHFLANPAVTMVLTTLWVAGLVNAYNFMDGIDGLAGGQAVVAGLGWAAAGMVAGIPAVTFAGLLLACASAVFLLFNWQPAKVFMGDAGSAFLGYAFAVLPLAAGGDLRAFTAGALFVWPFLFDTAFTLARRLRRRENVMQAHRSHLYQRLTSTGLTHAQVTTAYLVLAALGAPAAIALFTASAMRSVVLAAVVPIAAAMLWRTVVARETMAAARRATT